MTPPEPTPGHGPTPAPDPTDRPDPPARAGSPPTSGAGGEPGPDENPPRCGTDEAPPLCGTEESPPLCGTDDDTLDLYDPSELHALLTAHGEASTAPCAPGPGPAADAPWSAEPALTPEGALPREGPGALTPGSGLTSEAALAPGSPPLSETVLTPGSTLAQEATLAPERPLPPVGGADPHAGPELHVAGGDFRMREDPAAGARGLPVGGDVHVLRAPGSTSAMGAPPTGEPRPEEPDLLDSVGEWPEVPTPFGQFRLVPVRLPRDLALIAAWMNDPAVSAFWELEGPEERTEAHVREQLDGDGRSVPCLGVLEGRPVGYWEVYRADLDPVARYYRARPHDTGLHLLLGEVADRGRGVGTALLRAVADLVLDHRPRCGRVLAEPDLRNTPSVAAFLGAGFRFGAEVDLPGKRAALMVRDRELRTLL